MCELRCELAGNDDSCEAGDHNDVTDDRSLNHGAIGAREHAHDSVGTGGQGRDAICFDSTSINSAALESAGDESSGHCTSGHGTTDEEPTDDEPTGRDNHDDESGRRRGWSRVLVVRH